MTNLLEYTRRPDISFNRNGVIRITARVARLLSLQPGDSINIAVDDGEYFLHAIHRGNNTDTGRFEARCYPSKRGGGKNLCANSTRLCRTLLDAVGINYRCASFAVGNLHDCNGRSVVPIITRRPITTSPR